MTKLIRTLLIFSVFAVASASADIVSFDIVLDPSAGDASNDCVGYYSNGNGFDNCVIFAEDLGQGDGDVSSIIAKWEDGWEESENYPDFDGGDVTLTGGLEDSSGSWSYDGEIIRFWVVKSSTGFRVFYDAGDASCTNATANTFDCMTSAVVVNGGNWATIDRQGLSHISFYDTEVMVPEPGTLLLLGAGLLGIGARRRMKSKA